MTRLNNFVEYQEVATREDSKVDRAINAYNNRPHIPVTPEEARELGILAGRIGELQAEAERILSPEYKALTDSMDREAEYLCDRINLHILHHISQ